MIFIIGSLLALGSLIIGMANWADFKIKWVDDLAGTGIVVGVLMVIVSLILCIGRVLP